MLLTLTNIDIPPPVLDTLIAEPTDSSDINLSTTINNKGWIYEGKERSGFDLFGRLASIRGTDCKHDRCGRSLWVC